MVIPLRFAVQHPLVTLGLMLGSLPVSLGAVAIGFSNEIWRAVAMLALGLGVWALSIFGLVRALRNPLGRVTTIRLGVPMPLSRLQEQLGGRNIVREPDGAFRFASGSFTKDVAFHVESEDQRGVVLRITGRKPLPEAMAQRLNEWTVPYTVLAASD